MGCLVVHLQPPLLLLVAPLRTGHPAPGTGIRQLYHRQNLNCAKEHQGAIVTHTWQVEPAPEMSGICGNSVNEVEVRWRLSARCAIVTPFWLTVRGHLDCETTWLGRPGEVVTKQPMNTLLVAIGGAVGAAGSLLIGGWVQSLAGTGSQPGPSS